jgi:Lrp/AsnC family transcriptional regulator, leucine-responsive regulatory protein
MRPGRLVADYRYGVEDIDRKILSLLSQDGRISFTELSRRTGLSVSATHQRVRRLERRGVIRSYAAMIDPAGAGLPLTAFISIKPFDPAAPDDAPERLAHLPSIEACHSVAGEENYILKVRVASPTALEDLLQQIRACAGVSTRTTIVLSTPFENRPPDLGAALDGAAGWAAEATLNAGEATLNGDAAVDSPADEAPAGQG